MKIAFLFIAIILVYTWLLYYLILNMITRIKKIKIYTKKIKKTVSVIITVHNEEEKIWRRINNIIESNYPKELLEIVVVSDGSTDRTVDIARSMNYKKLKVIDLERQGKALAQNNAIKTIKSKIIVFTDADTKFQKDFIGNMIKYYADIDVGCVVGNLKYININTPISYSESVYWKIEKKIRQLESEIGILVTASGACMSIRKNLWRKLKKNEDSDFITPIDVVLQEKKVLYASDAIAFDTPPLSIREEFYTRIRQTAKNFPGTIYHWGLKGWLEHPIIGIGIMSHKIFRWITPFFMIAIFIINAELLKESSYYVISFIIQIIFYLMAIIGLVETKKKGKLPICATITNFCVAALGMGLGVAIGIIGKAPSTFKSYKKNVNTKIS